MKKFKTIFLIALSVTLPSIFLIACGSNLAKPFENNEYEVNTAPPAPEVEAFDEIKVEVKVDEEVPAPVKPEEIDFVDYEFIEKSESLDTDLDGDGDLEKITYNMTPLEEDDYIYYADITIDDLTVEDIIDKDGNHFDEEFVGFYTGELSIVKIPGVKEKLIILSDYGPSDDHYSQVFMYRDKKFRYLGGLEGILSANTLLFEEDGTMISNTRSWYLQTWFYNREYILHGDEIVAIYRDFYPVSQFSFIPDVKYESTTYLDFDFYTRPEKWAERVTLPPGTKVVFTATSETGWIELIANDTTYYIYVDDCNYIDGDSTLPADMLFSDLIFAD